MLSYRYEKEKMDDRTFGREGQMKGKERAGDEGGERKESVGGRDGCGTVIREATEPSRKR